MEKLTICSSCTSRMKEPKQLPCGHTFCKQCLQPLANGTKIRCPECLDESKLPPGGVEGIETDLTMTKLLELVTTEVKIKCQECKEKDVKAECQHCDKILCENCLSSHTPHLVEKWKNAASKIKVDISEESAKVNQREKEVDSNAMEMKKEIDEWCEKLTEEIHMKSTALKSEVDHFAGEEKKSCQNQLEKLQEHRAKKESYREHVQKMIQELSVTRRPAHAIVEQQKRVIAQTKSAEEYAKMEDMKVEIGSKMAVFSDEGVTALIVQTFQGTRIVCDKDIAEDPNSSTRTKGKEGEESSKTSSDGTGSLSEWTQL